MPDTNGARILDELLAPKRRAFAAVLIQGCGVGTQASRVFALKSGNGPF